MLSNALASSKAKVYYEKKKKNLNLLHNNVFMCVVFVKSANDYLSIQKPIININYRRRYSLAPSDILSCIEIPYRNVLAIIKLQPKLHDDK